MHPAQVADLIRAAMPGAEVVVDSPDQTHFSARIVSPAFAGLRGVAKQLWLMRAIDGDERGRIEVATKLAKGTRLQAGRAMEDWELAEDGGGDSDFVRDELAPAATSVASKPASSSRRRNSAASICGRRAPTISPHIFVSVS